MAENGSADDGRQTGFPQSPSAFGEDERISWSKVDAKYVLETDEGNEYEWDDALKRWVDQELLDQQAAIYRVEGVDEHIPAAQNKKKRKQDGDEDGQKQKKQKVNSACYVTSIPLDADKDEIKHVFGKMGVIAEELESGEPRIKMYEDEKGQFKGDALVVFFRPESVDLAVQMLDDTEFRLGTQGPNGNMRVQAADFSYKAQQEAPAKKNKKDLKRIIKKSQKMNNKLADWDDDDPQQMPETSSKFDKVVILKHMFTPAELEEDPSAILDIKEDIRDECAKLGAVTNVILYDLEPAGVASVKFSDPDAAKACVETMNGRWFDERQLVAYISTGDEKFKKSKGKSNVVGGDESDEGEGGRLDAFGEWLEQEQ
ncbi:Splicing factor U2AF-associated protein 2 [Cyphellophora attinorum]|uniref:Splicing factor U2AF-associated protein 2 n=1 Tax=Cyphellophora attinorum TaxID=1664694 RepID=A0A0N1H761_9EURO|nr:Splicing factor U2AF-associated protein 2 [Phialophora attinorum]KPI42193.1 Splicing factor U2AF-associated protein 2 [Phialophora attinorum]